MDKNIICKTDEFLYNHLKNSNASEEQKKYRYEHTLRVTNIGIELAKKENADIGIVTLGCLLHDVGKFDTDNDMEHGRVSAKVAEKFLRILNLSEKQIKDICYSIASHVDGGAGYEYDDIPEAKIVSDADNIDRFGAYRLLEAAKHAIEGKTLEEQKKIVSDKLERYKKYYSEGVMETKSGNEWFRKQLELGILFFQSYLEQLNITVLPEKIAVESRCGIKCSECGYRESAGCKGCVNIDKPFWGEKCMVKYCCENKQLSHCGECDAFPCDLLNSFSYDKEQGDNGARIKQCRKWAEECK